MPIDSGTPALKASDTALGEFGRIRTLLAPLSSGCAGSFGLKDDAASLSLESGQELVVSTDTIVEGIHYLGKEAPEDIAAKLLAVNLSDLAAKGADPLCYSLSLALRSDQDDGWVTAFAQGLRQQQEKHDCHLLGGDSVRTTGPAVLTVTIYGTVPSGQMIKRAGAGEGDLVFVTGTIGDGALGLLAARGDFGSGAEVDFLADRYRRPIPRLELRETLREYATAAMDVSDGLVGDLAMLAEASDLGVELEASKVPLSDAASELLADDPSLMKLVLTGGDDYELLMAIPAVRAEAFEMEAARVNCKVALIGKLSKNLKSGNIRVLDSQGQEIALDSTKFVHG